MKIRNYMYNKQWNAMCVDLDFYTRVYFSYDMVVAFMTSDTGLIVSENKWGATTGKHINAISTQERTPREGFVRMYNKHVAKKHNLELLSESE